MLKYLKKGIVFLVSGSFSIILAACYAAESEYTYYRKIQIKNGNGDPIPGLKVTTYDNDQELNIQQSTDAGMVEIQIIDGGVHSYKVLIEDIDSTENLGHFQTTSVNLDSLEYDDIFLDEVE